MILMRLLDHGEGALHKQGFPLKSVLNEIAAFFLPGVLSSAQ